MRSNPPACVCYAHWVRARWRVQHQAGLSLTAPRGSARDRLAARKTVRLAVHARVSKKYIHQHVRTKKWRLSIHTDSCTRNITIHTHAHALATHLYAMTYLSSLGGHTSQKHVGTDACACDTSRGCENGGAHLADHLFRSWERTMR